MKSLIPVLLVLFSALTIAAAVAGGPREPLVAPEATLSLGQIEGHPVTVSAELRWPTFSTEHHIRLDIHFNGDGFRPEGSAYVVLWQHQDLVGTLWLEPRYTESGLVYVLELTRAAFERSRFSFRLENVDPPTSFKLRLSDCMTDSVAAQYENRPVPTIVPAPDNIRDMFAQKRVGPAVTIEIGRRQEVEVIIFNIRGDTVAVAHTGLLDAGEHTIRWDGRDLDGHEVPAGVYSARIRTEEWNDARSFLYPSVTFPRGQLRDPWR